MQVDFRKLADWRDSTRAGMGGMGAFSLATGLSALPYGGATQKLLEGPKVKPLTGSAVNALKLALGVNPEVYKMEKAPTEAAFLFPSKDPSQLRMVRDMGADVKKFRTRGLVLLGDISRSRPGLVAHELGHSQLTKTPRLLQAFKMSKGLQRGLLPTYKGITLPVSIGAAAISDPDSIVSKAAPIAAVAAVAPELFEEGRASVSGLRAMKRSGFNPTQLKAARKLLGKAYLTYLGTGLGAVAGTVLARRYKKRAKGN